MKNKVLIFPTDTVYGIGASLFDTEGQKRIFAIKNRPLDKPLAVLCASLEQIEAIAEVKEDGKKLIKAFLPGPLTVILNAKEAVYQETGLKTIGVRIPKYDVALKILTEEGPMSTTSVNESGRPSLNDYYVIKETYGLLVDDIYPPSNDATSSLPSTVVDLTGEEVKVLRFGAISLEMIKEVLK